MTILPPERFCWGTRRLIQHPESTGDTMASSTASSIGTTSHLPSQEIESLKSEVARLKKSLEAKDADLNERNRQITTKNSILVAAFQTIKSMGINITRKAKYAKAREQRIQNLTRKLSIANQTIKANQTRISNLTTKIHGANRSNQSKNRLLLKWQWLARRQRVQKQSYRLKYQETTEDNKALFATIKDSMPSGLSQRNFVWHEIKPLICSMPTINHNPVGNLVIWSIQSRAPTGKARLGVVVVGPRLLVLCLLGLIWSSATDECLEVIHQITKLIPESTDPFIGWFSSMFAVVFMTQLLRRKDPGSDVETMIVASLYQMLTTTKARFPEIFLQEDPLLNLQYITESFSKYFQTNPTVISFIYNQLNHDILEVCRANQHLTMIAYGTNLAYLAIKGIKGPRKDQIVSINIDTMEIIAYDRSSILRHPADAFGEVNYHIESHYHGNLEIVNTTIEQEVWWQLNLPAETEFPELP
ncbi:hypothetical protein HYFRA_00009009 [Hymenoscyphus fraxineus]|uniref:Uncharacterized protein n=1 Tax=Hymenoscyphus fraxineus TaxID=746836 RepID=A0A9N9KRF9_9HELO|nr:hypothetical protein HYFRA_00009009 [Hymenoscyphus fraxineus]